MISPLPPQTTRTGFPGTINTIQTKLWGPGVAPRIPLPLIQSQNSILCPLEALCTAQGSSLSSPAPACLFPLPQLSQHEAGKGSAVGGQGGNPGVHPQGLLPCQHSPVPAPDCTPLLHCSLGPHTPEACFRPNSITAKSGKLSPWKKEKVKSLSSV